MRKAHGLDEGSDGEASEHVCTCIARVYVHWGHAEVVQRTGWLLRRDRRDSERFNSTIMWVALSTMPSAGDIEIGPSRLRLLV